MMKLEWSRKSFGPVCRSYSGTKVSVFIQVHMILHLCALCETPGCTYRSMNVSHGLKSRY